MKMFALRGKKKEMELPGDFFVDSMCVALPQGWSGRGAAATAQPGAGGLSWRGWGAATAGTGNQEEHRELQAPAPPRAAGSGPASCPGAMGPSRGMWGSSTAQLCQLTPEQLQHRAAPPEKLWKNFPWFDLKTFELCLKA